MYRLIAISALTLLLLSGCADVSNNAGKKDGPALYYQACAACHGEKLEGGSAPGLKTDKVKSMSEDDIVNLVENGKGRMPGKTLSEPDARIVAAWLKEQNK